MKKLLILLIIIPIGFTFASNPWDKIVTETDDSVKTERSRQTQSKWYYGGNVGFNFWNNYFYLSVQPLVGYKVTPKISVGGKLGYSYINYSNIDPSFSSHNFGGSIFTRYRVIPQIYLHGEFVYASFDRRTTIFPVNNEWPSERVWVPFLLLGGGYAQMVSPNVWVFVEVLFDVLQDSDSPYENWDPFVSFGAGVGF
jgi:hypothetical protein